MFNKIAILILLLSCTSCVVLPVNVDSQSYQCGLSTDKKTLKVVNLNDGGTAFYEWQDELFAIISIPTSAIISGTYVLVNNIYHIGEKQIKCDKTKTNQSVNVDSAKNTPLELH